MLHSLNTFCNNCLNFTVVDPRLKSRNLHPHVFSICRKIGVHPVRIDLEKDIVKVALTNQAVLDVHPSDDVMEMFISKEQISQWPELLAQLDNRESFNSKSTLHDAIAQFDSRDLRFLSVRFHKGTDDIEVSLFDFNGDKKNCVDKVMLTKDGIRIHYKHDMHYDLYKAFNLSFYEY